MEEERKLTGKTWLPKTVPAGEDALMNYAPSGAERIK